MTTAINTWEEQALMHSMAASPPDLPPCEPLFYPGLYSPSGIDLLTILAAIHTRPHPTIPLGAVDTSCALIISDLTQPDQPIIYASDGFAELTGYSTEEVMGRNCRFLQAPPLSPSEFAAATRSLPLPGQGTWVQSQGLDQGLGVGEDGLAAERGRSRAMTNGTTVTNGNVVRKESVKKRRGYGVDRETVRTMRKAVQRNREVQVEVVNYKKSGEAFVNLVTIIPVRVPVSGEERGLGGDGGFNVSVGFLCDISEEGC